MVIKKHKIKYCKENDIYLPPRASEDIIDAAIANAYLHNKEVKFEYCFGAWEGTITCTMCSFEQDCFYAKVGEKKEKWISRIEKLENPKYSFKTLRKNRNKKSL